MGDRMLRAANVTLSGEDYDNTAAGTTGDITVYFRDKSGYIMWATGPDVPVDTSVGYARGCLFVDTNIAAGTGSLYINKGTPATAEFSLVTQAA